MPALTKVEGPTVSPRPERRAGRRSAARRGFTLIEAMVTLTLIGIIVGTLLDVVMRQQRFAGAANDVMEVRDNLRQIGDLFPMELRAVTPAEGDIFVMSDSAIEFRQSAGVSVVCDTLPGRTTVILPPTALATDAGITSWIAAPAVGDELYIFDPRGELPDTLIRYTVAAAPTPGPCLPASGFTTTAAEGAGGLMIAIAPQLSPTTPKGAPVRFVRRARYSLYVSPSDGGWYLGFRDFNASRLPQWSAIQPVAGPLLPYAAAGAGGLRFQYFDANGVPLTLAAQSTQVRRIDITARAQTRSPVRTWGFGRTPGDYVRDSVRVSIALRNY